MNACVAQEQPEFKTKCLCTFLFDGDKLWEIIDMYNVHLVFTQPFCGLWAHKAGHETSLTMAHNFGSSFSALLRNGIHCCKCSENLEWSLVRALLKNKNTEIQLQPIQLKVNFVLLLSSDIISLQRSKAFANHAIRHGLAPTSIQLWGDHYKEQPHNLFYNAHTDMQRG